MTREEFILIMIDAGYENKPDCSIAWRYEKNHDFECYETNKDKDEIILHLSIHEKKYDNFLESFGYVFKNVSKMNSIEFKKQLEGMTEYVYSLYMDINRHISAMSEKIETKANRLGIKLEKELGY